MRFPLILPLERPSRDIRRVLRTPSVLPLSGKRAAVKFRCPPHLILYVRLSLNSQPAPWFWAVGGNTRKIRVRVRSLLS